MIPEAFSYERAGSVAEALEHMGRGALPLAGGHSLVPALKLRLSAPASQYVSDRRDPQRCDDAQTKPEIARGLAASEPDQHAG